VNKQKLLEQLQERLQQKVDATLNAVKEAHALASHEQSKPENQYDTLALEAAYLAHGQSERIAELQKQMILLNHFEFIELSQESPISVGALICVEEIGSELQWLWLLPVAGGEQLILEDKDIRTITPEAPLAEKLIGQYLGDEVVLNLGHKKKQFEVIELL
jgi:transcription elongation GreA/GreB family factor